MSKRPKLVRASEELKHLSVSIEAELRQLADVTVRPMFGMRACYRGRTVFAMLADKRAFGRPDAIAYKPAPRRKWQLLEIEHPDDVRGTLAHLIAAYKKAAGTRK